MTPFVREESAGNGTQRYGGMENKKKKCAPLSFSQIIATWRSSSSGPARNLQGGEMSFNATVRPMEDPSGKSGAGNCQEKPDCERRMDRQSFCQTTPAQSQLCSADGDSFQGMRGIPRSRKSILFGGVCGRDKVSGAKIPRSRHSSPSGPRFGQER